MPTPEQNQWLTQTLGLVAVATATPTAATPAKTAAGGAGLGRFL